jgi:hypothetical protein
MEAAMRLLDRLIAAVRSVFRRPVAQPSPQLELPLTAFDSGNDPGDENDFQLFV